MQTFIEKLKSIYLKGEGLPHDQIVPTVGLNIGRIEDANVKLVFWDLGGQVWFLLQSYRLVIDNLVVETSLVSIICG
jgi:ADP-ribosylation factor related protein 1